MTGTTGYYSLLVPRQHVSRYVDLKSCIVGNVQDRSGRPWEDKCVSSDLTLYVALASMATGAIGTSPLVVVGIDWPNTKTGHVR